MTTSTLTVTEFVLARIAEDEAAAAIATPGPWFVDQVGDIGDKGAALEIARWRGHLNTVDLGEDFLTANHIARHDPARVLAQCAAMRKIVERGLDCDEAPIGGYCYCCEMSLRAVASIWDSHPDWREEWA